MDGIKNSKNIIEFLDSIALIESVEKKANVKSWKFGKIHIWPIIKYVIVKKSIQAMQKDFQPTKSFDHIVDNAKSSRLRANQKNKNLKELIRKKKFVERIKYYYEEKKQREKTLSTLFLDSLNLTSATLFKSSVLFFGSAKSATEIDGKWLHPHHHGFRQCLDSFGTRSIGLYHDSNNSDSFFGETNPYGENINLDPFLRWIMTNTTPPDVVQGLMREVFSDRDNVIRRTGLGIETLSAFCDITIGRTDAIISHFLPFLNRFKPKAVFTSNYASPHGWAMAYSCRQTGIAFIDIQHGLGGTTNGGYYWTSTPRGDWNILPSVHFAWTKTDADLFLSGHPRRRAFVTGPITFSFRNSLNLSVPSLNKVKKEKNGKVIVLYLGQFAEDVLIAKKLKSAGMNILFRSHPMRHEESRRLVDHITAEELRLDFCQRSLLPDLLDYVDAAITHHSASIIEANMAGKPVFAIGPYAEIVKKEYKEETEKLLTIDKYYGQGDLASRIADWISKIKVGEVRSVKTISPKLALDSLGIKFSN